MSRMTVGKQTSVTDWIAWVRALQPGRRLLAALFPEPSPCPGCRRPVGFDVIGLCDRCLSRVPSAVSPICQRCGRPLRRVTDESVDQLCRQCRPGRRFFTVARAPTVYADSMKDYIHRFKYGGERELGLALGVIMGRFLERERILWPIDALVPVPLHPDRLEERGFNQADVLAKKVADWVGRPRWTDALQRVRVTPSQTRLSVKARCDNVKGAFRAPHPASLAGRRLLLVDDVLTSGATADEAARVLLRAGAAEVKVLCLAVGVLPDHWVEGGQPRSAPPAGVAEGVESRAEPNPGTRARSRKASG